MGKCGSRKRQLALLDTRTLSTGTMPDLKGLGLKDALFLVESMKLKVQVKGKGKVVSQSVVAGTAIKKDNTVVLELN